MTKEQLKVLTQKGIKFAMIDEETFERIEKIKQATESNTISILNAAIQLIEKSLGREIAVREDDKSELLINKFKKFSKLSKIKE